VPGEAILSVDNSVKP